MSLEAAIFWTTGAAFFALQAATIGYLLWSRRAARARREPDRRRQVEVVWTIVPAAVLAALALMVSGLTAGSWSRVRGGTAPLGTGRTAQLETTPAASAPAGDAR